MGDLNAAHVAPSGARASDACHEMHEEHSHSSPPPMRRAWRGFPIDGIGAILMGEVSRPLRSNGIVAGHVGSGVSEGAAGKIADVMSNAGGFTK
jgi:hypothetical protein